MIIEEAVVADTTGKTQWLCLMIQVPRRLLFAECTQLDNAATQDALARCPCRTTASVCARVRLIETCYARTHTSVLENCAHININGGWCMCVCVYKETGLQPVVQKVGVYYKCAVHEGTSRTCANTICSRERAGWSRSHTINSVSVVVCCVECTCARVTSAPISFCQIPIHTHPPIHSVCIHCTVDFFARYLHGGQISHAGHVS
jgi:hypothetical protein